MPLEHPMLSEDDHNRELVSHVHPPDWINPEPAPRYNLVVIGAGTAGLVTAAGAAGLGAKVALIEKDLMGGDCLNVGCVPSKAIIRSARAAGAVQDAARFGVHVPAGTEVDFPAVMKRMRKIRARISHNDSAARFRDLGVDVFLGPGRFSGPDTAEVGDTTLRFRRAVIATGARALRLPIPGLQEAGALTNETVFSLTERPRRLAVIGAGPIGAEMAQTFRRLGSEVVLFDALPQVLGREDPDAARIVHRAFERDGIRMVLGCKIDRVEPGAAGKTIHFACEGSDDSVIVDEILVGAGRAPNIEGIGLEAAGVRYERTGVVTDENLRTSNPRIFAAGDITLDYKFTHSADFSARIVIQNALFMGRKKISALTIPWCTYTSPEVAHVGLYEADAREKGIEVDTWLRPFDEVDRAIADGEEEGFVKILTRKGTDQIVGATIVASHAGDLISEVTLAMTQGIGLGKIAAVIHPYPTQAEAIRQLGDAYNRTRLTPFVKGLFQRWLAFTR